MGRYSKEILRVSVQMAGSLPALYVWIFSIFAGRCEMRNSAGTNRMFFIVIFIYLHAVRDGGFVNHRVQQRLVWKHRTQPVDVSVRLTIMKYPCSPLPPWEGTSPLRTIGACSQNMYFCAKIFKL